MAERRMMAKSVIETDQFMDMPMSSQCLYFHLLLRADDDGFITSPRRIMREVGCHEDDMKLLVAKNYIIPFDSGVIVIKHWKIHNFIRSDRYTPTHCDERALVELTKKKVYEFKEPDGHVTTYMDTNGIPHGIPTGTPPRILHGNQTATTPDTQVRLGKVNSTTTTTTEDPELGEVFKAYADNISPAYGPIECEKLTQMYDQYQAKWVLAAIEEAVTSTRRPSLNYVRSILERWEHDGFKAPKPKRGKKKEERRDGETGLHGAAGETKSPYAAYFDGDTPEA